MKKARQNKYWYYLLTCLSILIAGAITWVNILEGSPELIRRITVTLSIILSFITGVVILFRFQTNWTRYRIFAEESKVLLSELVAECNDCKLNDRQVNSYLYRINTLSNTEISKWKILREMEEDHTDM